MTNCHARRACRAVCYEESKEDDQSKKLQLLPSKISGYADHSTVGVKMSSFFASLPVLVSGLGVMRKIKRIGGSTS